MAEKARNASTKGSNRTCTNERSRENKCNNSMFSTEDKRGSMKPICNGCG